MHCRLELDADLSSSSMASTHRLPSPIARTAHKLIHECSRTKAALAFKMTDREEEMESKSLLTFAQNSVRWLNAQHMSPVCDEDRQSVSERDTSSTFKRADLVLDRPGCIHASAVPTATSKMGVCLNVWKCTAQSEAILQSPLHRQI